ncbi:hypothetical protein M427DRAFT_266105 [Gonapodya prolifera JEL478]|uniref:F-box domain-containing protein n=1 Tax=Gonapodya prolifera (strain JEL478) TaxID=1344416 RepID=A0A139AKP6_GONPJ|nr:hypothetical protein M427DRAFT_266105 [Gonapodya prolifera JEL478]|eukprot:KXS17268.1 hypothetical protein M427DRAFT_266105 [Gonapodya prolifera JEL478]
MCRRKTRPLLGLNWSLELASRKNNGTGEARQGQLSLRCAITHRVLRGLINHSTSRSHQLAPITSIIPRETLLHSLRFCSPRTLLGSLQLVSKLFHQCVHHVIPKNHNERFVALSHISIARASGELPLRLTAKISMLQSSLASAPQRVAHVAISILLDGDLDNPITTIS